MAMCVLHGRAMPLDSRPHFVLNAHVSKSPERLQTWPSEPGLSACVILEA